MLLRRASCASFRILILFSKAKLAPELQYVRVRKSLSSNRELSKMELGALEEGSHIQADRLSDPIEKDRLSGGVIPPDVTL